MPASRRTILLIAIAAVLLGAFAVLPAPRLIFRRSPVVSDRTAGDVRRVAMTVEPDGSLHAVAEVWTDSDWDIEYWSSITGLTPVARVVTIDLIEQREAAIAMSGDRLVLAWIDYDAKAKTYALHVTTKRRIDRNWATPVLVASGTAKLTQPSVAVDADGGPLVAYVADGKLFAAALTPGRAGISFPQQLAARPSIAAFPSGGFAIAFERDDHVWLLDRRPGGGVAPTRIARGRAPALVATSGGFALAWADRDAIVAYEGNQGRRIPAPGLGESVPAIAFAGSDPVAAWPAGREIRVLKSDGTNVTLAGRGACCAAVAASGERVWTAWLSARPGAAIFREALLRFEGPAGRFTTAERIPVVALPASR